MPCPTCSATMQKFADDQDGALHWWCPRCGTLRTQYGTFDGHEAPALVERCRKFEAAVGPAHLPVAWRQLGVAESINPSEARPAVTVTEDDGEADPA